MEGEEIVPGVEGSNADISGLGGDGWRFRTCVDGLLGVPWLVLCKWLVLRKQWEDPYWVLWYGRIKVEIWF